MEAWQQRQETLLPGSCDVLASKHVTVFGIGGVGSFLCEALARAGIGAFTLIDADEVSESNINRQLIATHKSIGRKKTELMRERILEINPKASVECITRFVTEKELEGLMSFETDYIADAVDTVSLKLELARFAFERNIPIIASMGTGNKLHPELFELADIYDTSVCPLCRAMRSRLKAMGVASLRVVYSKEEPVKVTPKKTDGRYPPASISFTPPVAGMLMAGEIVRNLI